MAKEKKELEESLLSLGGRAEFLATLRDFVG